MVNFDRLSLRRFVSRGNILSSLKRGYKESLQKTVLFSPSAECSNDADPFSERVMST